MYTDSDIKAIGRLVKKRRTERGMTAKQLARQVGISDAHIIYIEKGQRKPTFEKMMNILDALGIGFNEMLREIGRKSGIAEPAEVYRPYSIPVVTWVRAGAWREVCDSFEPGDADEWIETDIWGPNVFALRVSGDSMEPEFIDGDVIVVNPHIEVQPNDFAVIKNPEGEATFKQLKRYGRTWLLHPLNPRYPDIELKRGDFQIIGKVVKKEKHY